MEIKNQKIEIIESDSKEILKYLFNNWKEETEIYENNSFYPRKPIIIDVEFKVDSGYFTGETYYVFIRYY